MSGPFGVNSPDTGFEEGSIALGSLGARFLESDFGGLSEKNISGSGVSCQLDYRSASEWRVMQDLLCF